MAFAFIGPRRRPRRRRPPSAREATEVSRDGFPKTAWALDVSVVLARSPSRVLRFAPHFAAQSPWPFTASEAADGGVVEGPSRASERNSC